MKLSIKNFKTISDLKDLNINSINIISGVNSSGKTSLIQFLLMLKQTLEAQSVNPALIFDGDWVKLGSFSNLVYKKNMGSSIGFSLEFDKEYIKDRFPEIFKIESVKINAEYLYKETEIYLSNVKITYKTSQRQHFIEFSYIENLYTINSDSALLIDEFNNLMNKQGNINTTSFFPTIFSTELDNPKYPEFDKNPTVIAPIKVKIDEVQAITNIFFSSISYLGPLRETPQDLYNSNNKNNFIGSKGEYAAQFLEEESNDTTEFYDIQANEIKKMPLSDAVKYWICDVFNLAKDINAEKHKDSYVVKVMNRHDVESTIRHVGFGISQVLPIIVEGLRMRKNGILILEQPEIHLHPKIQSMLFDFIYSLSLTGKKFIIETHSDHFITRMRRRVAEDNSNLSEKINLVFIEERETEYLFHKLNLDDMGTYDYFPNDFVDQSEDYDAIILAQAKKMMEKNK